MSEANASIPIADLVLRNIISKTGKSVPVDDLFDLLENPIIPSDLGNFMALSSAADLDSTGNTDVTAGLQALVDQYSVVIVEPGTYQVLNLQLANCRVIGMPGAKFLGELGERDNCVVLGSGGYIDSIDFDVYHNQAPYLGNGNYGNAVRVGDYVQDRDDLTQGFGLSKAVITNTGNIFANATSIIGDASGGCLENVHFRGKWGTGILTHWSGDVDNEDPHHSTVTYSLHPNKISLTNITGGLYNGIGGDSLITISASYDIEARNVDLEGWNRILYLLPGDVYDLVANDKQRGKVMTGIHLENFTHRNPAPRDPSSTNYPATIRGASATPRTSAGTAYATDYSPQVNINGLRFVWGDTSTVYTGAALTRLYYSKGVNVTGLSVEGFEDALCFGYELRMSNDCHISGKTDTRLGNRIQSGIDCTVDVQTIGSPAARDSAAGQGLILQDIAVGGSFSSSATAGAESFSFTPTSSGAINAGGLVEFGGLYCTLTKTVLFTANQTVTVYVDGLPSSSSSGDAVAVRGYARNCKIKGLIQQYYFGIAVAGAFNVKIACKFIGNGRRDINASDTKSRFVHINDCDFESVGSTDAGSGTKANIYAGNIDGWTISDSRFELSGGRKTERNIIVTAETSGLDVRDNDFGYSSLTPIGSLPQSVAAAKKGRNQYRGNASIVSPGELPVTATFGYLIGGNYFGYAPSSPTSGYWVKGDILMNPTASVGQPRGWQCTVTSETGGTWVSLGNL